MIPDQIGRYQILTPLGQGAMGQVFRAHDPDLNREVALKLVTLPETANTAEWRQRFRREVQAAARLNHPHIITVYDVGLDHEPPYLVMELLTGGSLKERLRAGPLPWPGGLALLQPLCQALAYAHHAGLIHRDVKPANVMFAGDDTLPLASAASELRSIEGWNGVLKLVDFGLARWQVGDQVTQTGEVVGTPAYMSPEQARGETVDARTDIFALGIILFEAIVGHNPLASNSMASTLTKLVSSEPIDLSPLSRKTPPQLTEVIRQAVAKDRSRRYHDCETLCRDLAACLERPGDNSPAISASSSSFTPSGADKPYIDNPQDLTLPPCAEEILKMMFATYQRVVIKEELGGSFAGSQVFLVRPIKDDSSPELPAVVKMAPIGLIQAEWQAYQTCIHRKLPGVAEIQDEPVLPPSCAWGGLRYSLVGRGGVFEIESLRQFCTQADIADISDVLKQQFFPLVTELWQFHVAMADFSLRRSYDFLLPVNLIIRPTSSLPDASPRLLRPGASTGQPPQPGDYVRLEGFVITEVDREQRAVTVDWPAPPGYRPAGYRLRLQPVEMTESYRVNNIIDPLVGQITAARADLLRATAQQALGQHIDLMGATVTLPQGDVLPNPLVTYTTLLSRTPNVKVACIHGDLNLENILVTPDPHQRNVYLIDFATARQDHVLHDFLRLETEVATKLIPEILAETGLPPETIYPFYEQLHCALLYPDRFGLPHLPHPALEKPFEMLEIIRRTARNYLFDADDWTEYYLGLTLYLLGTLKFSNLDEQAKQTAFWGAATTQKLLDTPPPCESLPSAETEVETEASPAPFWPIQPWLLAGGVVLLLIIIGFIISLLSFGSEGEQSPTASIISLRPKVDVRREGTDHLIPATFGLWLFQDDIVNTYAAATATIFCENGNIYILPEQNNLTLDCDDTTDVRFDPALSRQLVKATQATTLTLAAEETRAVRSEQTQTPLLLIPRNTVITDTRPAFHWQVIDGASGYRLTVNPLGEGETWVSETTATRLSYPVDAPPLAPGSSNSITLTTLDDDTVADKSLLQVLTETDQAELTQAEAEIRALAVDEAAQAYLLAQLYQQQGMWAAAAAQLERLTDSEGAASANLWQQLGDLYFQTGLYAQAEEHYQAALTAAEAGADLSAQAAAYTGLTRAAHAFKESEQALGYLSTAEELYRQLGQSEQADLISAERAKLEK
jgi:serine/threonine protein kinase